MDARSLVAEIAVELQDPDCVRWSAGQIVGYLNDAQRFIVGKSASATAQEVEITLVEGARQEVPANARSLLDVIRNVDGRQRAIRQVARGALDASAPNWAAGRGRHEVRHFITDARTPRLFDVYPPVAAGVKVLAMLCMEPVDLPAPSGGTADTVTGNLMLNDEYREAVRHYALFRAWSVDAEYGANAALAASHFAVLNDAVKAGPAPQPQP